MLQTPSLAQHQLAPWAHTSLGVNISGLVLTPALNETPSFQNNMKTKDTGLDDNNITFNIGRTSLLLSQLTQTTSSYAPVKMENAPQHDSSVIIKISLLLVVTALVLMASYKFVVHLFMGYSDRKDDAYSDSCSEDEDLTGMKKHRGPILDIG